MTTQNYVESIKSVFPDIKEPQIVKDLNTAQLKFASETSLLEERGALSSISSNVAWSLPAAFDRLTDVVLYDSDGDPLYLEDYDYGYEMEFGKFYIFSKNSTPITGLDTGIDTAYIHYKKLPATLDSRGTALEIDVQFRDAIEHDVLSKYFSKYPTDMQVRGEQVKGRDLSSASFHRKEYERLRIKAKRQLGARRKMGDPQIYQHAGKFNLPRRTDDASLGSTTTTQVSALSDIYAKWALFNVSSGASGEVTPSTTTVGYTTIAASITGLTMTVTSSGEFGNDTHIVTNDYLLSWVQNSDSEIVFTLPGSFTLISIEIWERI